MMAAAAIVHNLHEMKKSIKGVDPEKLIQTGSGLPLVQRVLRGETTFTREVRRGRALLNRKRKEPAHYFNLTEEYGELVSLLGGNVRWCCDNSERNNKLPLAARIVVWVFYLLAWVLLLLVCGIFLYTGVRERNVPQVLCGFVILGILVLIARLVMRVTKLMMGSDSSSDVMESFNSFFRWSPLFWGLMLDKAREIDAYIAEHPELLTR